jgi:hypothetical protein
MNIEQQKRFKKICLKFVNDFECSEIITGKHYYFEHKDLKHKMCVYFFDKVSWYIEIEPLKDFTNTIKLIHMVYEWKNKATDSISFNLGQNENKIDIFLKELESCYETWLLDLESKKIEARNEYIASLKEQLKSLEADKAAECVRQGAHESLCEARRIINDIEDEFE